MSYEFTPKADHVVIRFTGPMSLPDLVSVTAQLDKLDEELGASPHRFIDITGVTELKLDFAAVTEHNAKRSGRTLKNRVRTAIVAGTPIQFGMARMFEMLNQQHQTTVMVFRDPKAALDWLLPTPTK